jgi:hypothetical protein
MFADNADQDVIRQAIQAGVSAYVYDGIKSIAHSGITGQVASARFQAEQQLKNELADVQGKLSDRKLAEKAKGILMQQKQLPEDEAYQLLRRTAMNRNIRIAELAQQIINRSQPTVVETTIFISVHPAAANAPRRMRKNPVNTRQTWHQNIANTGWHGKCLSNTKAKPKTVSQATHKG